VRQLRAEGQNALYGDVLRPGTLDTAGIASAGSLILSTDVENAAEIIKQVRLLNPDLRILARCIHLREAPVLRRAGAGVVVAGEAEVGVALAEVVTAEDETSCHISVENREKIRRSLYRTPNAG
jgi:CPA2 family monovalent cation:H+ antiporter-2